MKQKHKYSHCLVKLNSRDTDSSFTDQTDLFNCLSFDNVLIAHFHSRVKQSFYEVSWTDPHEIGGFVCTWVTKSQRLAKPRCWLSRWPCLWQNPSYFQCHLPLLAPLSAALWTSCCQSAWWHRLSCNSHTSPQEWNQGCPWHAREEGKQVAL